MGTSDGRPRFDWQTASTNGSSASTTSRDAAWVAESGSVSATRVESPEERFDAVENLSLVEGDLADRDFVLQLLETYEPDTVLHAAAQPSAPYSSINGERALYTQRNNVSMNLNLLHGLAECGLDDTHFIETTTTGIYGAPHFPIPEGGMEVERKDGSDEVPFPAMGGSWYHQTKSFDAANMRLAESQFEFPMSEVRTAIVYGTETEETRDHESPTRFDFDYYFGTVVNRFCAQAVAGYPITVYGKGEQRKPMVSLEDTVESLVRLVEEGHSGDDGIDIYNQVTRPVAIVELAGDDRRGRRRVRPRRRGETLREPAQRGRGTQNGDGERPVPRSGRWTAADAGRGNPRRAGNARRRAGPDRRPRGPVPARRVDR